MLYFWLTNAVHQANRASMESMDGFLSGRKRKYKKNKDRLKKKYQSEPDLIRAAERSGASYDKNNRRTSSGQSTHTSASNTSLSSSC